MITNLAYCISFCMPWGSYPNKRYALWWVKRALDTLDSFLLPINLQRVIAVCGTSEKELQDCRQVVLDTINLLS